MGKWRVRTQGTDLADLQPIKEKRKSVQMLINTELAYPVKVSYRGNSQGLLLVEGPSFELECTLRQRIYHKCKRESFGSATNEELETGDKAKSRMGFTT